MKRCDNCFESNSDGATNCVICGEPLAVPQAMGGDDSTPGSSLHDFSDGAAQEMTQGSEVAVAVEDVVDDDIDAAYTAMDDDDDDVGPVEVLDDTGWEEAYFGGDDDDMNDVDPDADMDSDTDVDMDVDDAPIGTDSVKTGVATGQVVIQVYHDDEPTVVHVHPLVNDITLIGREDPHRDVFPDLDLGKLASKGVSARHVSRQHMRLLRDGNQFFVFVYKGTTGTQVCQNLVDPSQYAKRFEIQLGDRIVLGGKVRMKLTTEE